MERHRQSDPYVSYGPPASEIGRSRLASKADGGRSERRHRADGRPLAVLHVVAPARVGGLERVVSSLAVGQTRAGVDTRVLAILEPGHTAHPFVESLRDSGARLDTLVVAPRRYGTERRGVVEHCRHVRPDVVHVHGTRPDVLDSPVIRSAGFRVVSTVHGFTGGDLRNRVYEAMQRRALRRVHAAVAVSRMLGRQLVRSGVEEDRVHVIPNAAPPPSEMLERGAARAALGLPLQGHVVGWVGRLTREKGCDVLLDALAQLGRPAVTVSIVGDGRERAALERDSHSSDVRARLRWHGELPDAGRLLKAFDVLVLSSRTEGTPMVLFEAIQAGVPVIASAVGGIPDVVSSSEAMLVPAEDPGALALALRRSMDDPVAAAERARRAQVLIADAYSLPRWVERYTQLYTNLAAETADGGY